jgi:DNA-binding transcriptional MerR regulator/effector-binding domain-containing protein
MFRIGEFSKIAQVSGRLLRYYDELGLFKPVRIDAETGYRYYSAQQLPQLNRILALKELGLTLDQIARLLAGHVSTDEIRGMLAMKKAQIEQTLRGELLRFRYIESRIDQIDRDGELRSDDVVLKSVPTQKFISVHEPSITFTALQTAAWEMYRVLTAHVGARILGNFVVVLHSELWDVEKLNVEIGSIFNGNSNIELTMPDGKVASIRELPAVEMMATTMRVGLAELGHNSYTTLALWAEANEYSFVGSPREVFLQIRPGYEDEAVAEIQIPVKRLLPAPSLILSPGS